MKEVRVSRDWRQWPACLFGASVFLVIWIFSQDAYDALKFFLFFALFNCLPSLVLLNLLFPHWRDRGSPPLVLIAFAPVGGLIFLLPWWAADLKWGYFLIPVSALLLFGPARTSAVTPDSDRQQWPQLLFVAAALVGAPIVSLALTWQGPLNFHLLIQAARAAKLDTGFPAESAFVAGVPHAYNYAAHVWLAASSYLTGIPIENVVVYVAPALLLYCSASALAALGYYAGLRGWIVGLVVCCAFWYAGLTPIGARLFGRAFTWSAVAVIGPLLAFCASLILIMALSDWFSVPGKQRKGSAYAFAFLVMFVLVGSRAPGAIILLCAVSFLILCEIVVQKRLNFSSLAMSVVLAAATSLGLVIFLGYGSDFNPGSFTRISATPFPYLATYDFFWLPARLIANGVAPNWAGALQFACLVIVQAGFLTPFLVWRISASRRSYSPLEALLVGAGVAGIAAVFFLENSGGSQFSFLHYSTLAFSLLGGIALSETMGVRTRQFYAAAAIAAVLAVIQIMEFPFRALSGMALRLAPISSPERSIARRCANEPNQDFTERVPAGASVVLPANVDICQRLRFAIRNPHAKNYVEEWLRMFSGWETPLKYELTGKMDYLREGRPAALAATLPPPSYVMVRRGAEIALERSDSVR